MSNIENVRFTPQARYPGRVTKGKELAQVQQKKLFRVKWTIRCVCVQQNIRPSVDVRGLDDFNDIQPAFVSIS